MNLIRNYTYRFPIRSSFVSLPNKTYNIQQKIKKTSKLLQQISKN